MWPLRRSSSEKKQLIRNLDKREERRWWFYVLTKFGMVRSWNHRTHLWEPL